MSCSVSCSRNWENEGTRLLVVLDGFDYALAGTGLTRNLWDRLRALAQRTSLRLVTGSRRPLRELCRTEETRTSDFWEIFYGHAGRASPLSTTVTSRRSCSRSVTPAANSTTPRVRKSSTGQEECRYSVSALLQRLLEEHAGARLLKPEIDRAAAEVLGGRGQLLAALWDDCDE